MAVHDFTGLLEEPQDRTERHGLAAAGLTDEPEGFALVDVERNVVHRGDGAVVEEKVGP